MQHALVNFDVIKHFSPGNIIMILISAGRHWRLLNPSAIDNCCTVVLEVVDLKREGNNNDSTSQTRPRPEMFHRDVDRRSRPRKVF